MYHTITQIKHFVRMNVLQGIDWVDRYWFRSVLACLALYLVFTKDINIQLNMNSPSAMASSLAVNDYKAVQTGHATETTSKSGLASFFGSSSTSSSAHWSSEHQHLKALFPQNDLTGTELKVGKEACQKYVKRFAKVAQTEAKKFGIPASLKLAQALLESDAGQNAKASKANNHFGIKCTKRICKKSHCANFKGDSHKDFYKKYQSAWANFRAHSKLMQTEKYKHLNELGKNNYKDWAKGLQEAGYSKDPNYGSKLIQIIDALDLFKYDV